MNVLEARRRLLGAGVYKKTVTGNPAIAQGSLARMYPGIEMQGWTEQAQYEGKNLFDADKAKQLSSWIGTGFYRHFDIQLKPNTTYTLFVSQNNMYNGYKEEYDDNFALYLGKNENSANTNERFGNSSTDLEPLTFYTFTTTEGLYYINLYVNPWSEENLQITFDELLVNMMLVEGSSIVPYEPYTGGQPSPSPDYPQEIVSAGNWDETAQKWEYEIEISNAEQNPTEIQTVTLQSDRPLTKWDRLEKRGGQWGWVYKSEEIESYTDGGVPGEYFSTTGQLSTGAQVWYETTTETFVPLTTAEQEAMNALHTYRPTTVLSNDGGCEMSLTYKTKKSIEVTT